MRILFVTHHWYNNSHHSKYSGFQRIVYFASQKNDVTVVTWGKKSEKYVEEENGVNVIIVKPFVNNPIINRIIISLQARKIQDSFDVVHALYSDCTYFLKKNTYVVTFHVLPSIVKHKSIKSFIFLYIKYLLIQKRSLKFANKIVCVSNNIVQIISKFRKNVYFIPHGIDTKYWNINETDLKLKKKNMVLCVGSHGVNYDQLSGIINVNTIYEFHLVGIKDYPYNHKNCKKYSRISDEELKQLYRDAFFMVRPVYFATANNSLLEAMSMGCIIITNKLPGILDYLDNNSCIFIDDLNNFKIDENFNYDNIRNNAFKKIRNLYSWDKVFEAYENVYH